MLKQIHSSLHSESKKWFQTIAMRKHIAPKGSWSLNNYKLIIFNQSLNILKIYLCMFLLPTYLELKEQELRF